MVFTPRLRNLALTAHVTASVGWLGALAGFLAHAVASSVSQDAQMVRAADLAMGLIAWYVILPLCFASLSTGFIQALGTPWGVFWHYWVLAKLLLTALATFVLLLKMKPISFLAAMAAETTLSSVDLAGLRLSLVVHAGGGLLVLLAATTLAVYKPRGMTPYGVRTLHEQSGTGGDAHLGSNRESIGNAPRWVMVLGFVVIVLALLVVIMMITGNHGPNAHT